MNQLAIDFGNSNTVLALWNQQDNSAQVLPIPDLSVPGGFLIPSCICYETSQRYFAGDQVRQLDLPERRTFRWMKRYIGLHSPYRLDIGGEKIDAQRAAEDYLMTVMTSAHAQADFCPDELTLTVPVESFEYYSDWLLSLMKRGDAPLIRLIDEAAAAAAGYGVRLHPGDVLILFDFGGSTMQTAAVQVTEEGEVQGRCCRVLGKSGCNLGGMTLDRWIYTDLLRRCGLSEGLQPVREISRSLLRRCESLKETLSVCEQAEIAFRLSDGRNWTESYSRTDLEVLFEQNGLYDTVDRLLKETIHAAEDHGINRDKICTVIPIGGGSCIPSLRRRLTEVFSADRLAEGEPMGAAARGAAAYAGGLQIYDFIQHDYAVRYQNRTSGEYAYHTFIQRGTHYPSAAPLAELTICAAYDGQTDFGLAVYELQQNSLPKKNETEIFFEMDGSARIVPLTKQEEAAEQLFWLNERSPFFLHTDQPTHQGEARFKIHFEVDANKMLLVSALDLTDHSCPVSHQPVVKLS